MYNLLNIEIIIGINGDCLDRVFLRLFELKISCVLIRESIPGIGNVTLGEVFFIDSNIENIIFLFGNLFNAANEGLGMALVEASKGEYNVLIGIFNL
jgi:NADH:ubiquinone oxidoreductase subunit D